MIAHPLITTSPFTIPAAYYEHIGHEFNRHVQMSLLYTCKINILEKRNNKVVLFMCTQALTYFYLCKILLGPLHMYCMNPFNN